MIGLEWPGDGERAAGRWGKGSREKWEGQPGDGEKGKPGEVEMDGKLQCGMGIFAVFWHKMHCFFSADAKIANYTNYN